MKLQPIGKSKNIWGPTIVWAKIDFVALLIWNAKHKPTDDSPVEFDWSETTQRNHLNINLLSIFVLFLLLSTASVHKSHSKASQLVQTSIQSEMTVAQSQIFIENVVNNLRINRR